MKGYANGDKAGKVEESEYQDAQLKFAKDEEAERVDQYAKPGTSAKARAGDSYSYSYPTSRYRSRRP
jgi:hypothetical protein